MCLIIDANIRDVFFAQEPEFKAIWDWLRSGKGRLVFGGHQLEEMRGSYAAIRIITRLEQAGQAILAKKDVVDRETAAIEKFCTSNDAHVVALARVSGARTLVSNDDGLSADFKNGSLVCKPRGKIYRSNAVRAYDRKTCLNLVTHTDSCGNR